MVFGVSRKLVKFKFDIVELEVSHLLQLVESLDRQLINTAEVVLDFDDLLLHEAVHLL